MTVFTTPVAPTWSPRAGPKEPASESPPTHSASGCSWSSFRGAFARAAFGETSVPSRPNLALRPLGAACASESFELYAYAAAASPPATTTTTMAMMMRVRVLRRAATRRSRRLLVSAPDGSVVGFRGIAIRRERSCPALGRLRGRLFVLRQAELRSVQVGVNAAERQQVGMRSGLDDAALLDDHDAVGVDDRRETVRDHDRG